MNKDTKDIRHILENLSLVDDKALESQLELIIHSKNPISIGFLNQYAYNLICKDDSVKTNFRNIDHLFRDGKGIELACRYHNIKPKNNLNGTDLIPQLIDKLIVSSEECINFFAYGTAQPWLKLGSETLFKTKKIYSLDGFQPDQSYVAHYLKYQTDKDKLNVIVLAMGMPKQERIATLLKQQGKGRVIIICGGAILDFQAGRVKRAPLLFRKVGLEWFYRLACEPKRLFNRYVFGIPLFFWNVYKFRPKN